MRWAFAVGLALLLLGCSDDGSGGLGAAGDPAPFGVDGPFNNPTTVVGGSSEICIDGDNQCAVFELVNAERRQAGLSPYAYNPHLAASAQAHAADMVQQDYFSHTSLDGRSFGDRVNETEYTGSPTGENIAAGQRSPESVMESWMNSEGHRSNILSTRSTDIGVGFVDNYWVQVFGRSE